MNMDLKQETISSDVFKKVELIEAAAWNEMYDAADKFIRKDLGLHTSTVNGATLAMALQADNLAFNRVVGWGIESPAQESDLVLIKQKYIKAGVPRFIVQVSPHAGPAEMIIWLQQQNFELHNNWVKLYREAGDAPHPSTDYKITEAKKKDADVFASIVTEAFQWPEQVNFLISALIGRKNWKHFIAWEGNEPIATGSVFIKDDYAWFCFAATMTGYRAKGAQTALISKRIEAVNEAGCKHIFVETADDKGGNPSPSGRNLMRMGFKPLYKRPNYIFVNNP